MTEIQRQQQQLLFQSQLQGNMHPQQQMQAFDYSTFTGGQDIGGAQSAFLSPVHNMQQYASQQH